MGWTSVLELWWAGWLDGPLVGWMDHWWAGRMLRHDWAVVTAGQTARLGVLLAPPPPTRHSYNIYMKWETQAMCNSKRPIKKELRKQNYCLYMWFYGSLQVYTKLYPSDNLEHHL